MAEYGMAIDVLICGAGGFLGSHLAQRLKSEGCRVFGADLVYPSFRHIDFDGFHVVDLRDPEQTKSLFKESFNEVYQFAAEMGGAGYIFTGQHDAKIMHHSSMINLNVAEGMRRQKGARLFFPSSACVYPKFNQVDPTNPNCREDSAYPAQPDSEYGWEKLYAERIFQAYQRNYGIEVRVARLHNIYGPFGAYSGGREKAPAALCRKVVEAESGTYIEIWGDGQQTRSFTYVDDCIEGIIRIMRSNSREPLNLGSTELVTINDLASMVIATSGKNLKIKHVEGPQGVRGRNSDNQKILQRLNWEPKTPLNKGIKTTYHWIQNHIIQQKGSLTVQN